MDKRYQVFVSSTYSDLKEERAKVIQALMTINCIPSGMELFPAADEEQFEFIKRAIDDCDYYLVIIGGRYGSLTTEGVSWTEKEFDYAVEKGLKVHGFLHGSPGEIKLDDSELKPALREKLGAFRDKVKTERLVKFWQNGDELAASVTMSLLHTINTSPATGWVRADQVASTELLTEVNELRKENEALQSQVSEAQQEPPGIQNLADLDEGISIHGKSLDNGVWRSFRVGMSWNEIFAAISPYLVKHPSEAVVESLLAKAAAVKGGRYSVSQERHTIDEQEFMTVRTQLIANQLVSVRYAPTTGGRAALFWSLTSNGTAPMMELRTIRSTKTKAKQD